MPFETIIYEKTEAIAVVTLNRPESLNALNMKLKSELGAIFDQIGQNEEIRAVILTGAGKAFCAGADIKERSSTPTKSHEFYFTQKKTLALFDDIEAFPWVVIGAINGVAVGGGCELALTCDLRIASEDAKFGLPEVKIGVMPAGGGTQRLPRLIGSARAKELLLSGDLIDAREALRIGLVNRVVPADQLLEEAKKMAAKITCNPPLSVKFIKRAVNVGSMLDLRSAIDFETTCAALLIETEDREEGFRAFVEKRKPVYKGR